MRNSSARLLIPVVLSALLCAPVKAFAQANDSGRSPELEMIERRLRQLEQSRKAAEKQIQADEEKRRSRRAPSRQMSPEARDIERRLNELQAARVDAEVNRPFVWEINHFPDELGDAGHPDRGTAYVELHFAAREIPCFVRFRNLDSPGRAPVHAPMLFPGSQWISLERGRWEVSLSAGYASGPIVDFPPAELKVEGAEVYRLTFGRDHEIRTRDMARDLVAEREARYRKPSVEVSPNR